jgi:hypothetical protein
MESDPGGKASFAIAPMRFTRVIAVAAILMDRCRVPYVKYLHRLIRNLNVKSEMTTETNNTVCGNSQKFSIIQTLLSLVIPAMASSRPFGAGTP